MELPQLQALVDDETGLVDIQGLVSVLGRHGFDMFSQAGLSKRLSLESLYVSIVRKLAFPD